MAKCCRQSTTRALETGLLAESVRLGPASNSITELERSYSAISQALNPYLRFENILRFVFSPSPYHTPKAHCSLSLTITRSHLESWYHSLTQALVQTISSSFNLAMRLSRLVRTIPLLKNCLANPPFSSNRTGPQSWSCHIGRRADKYEVGAFAVFRNSVKFHVQVGHTGRSC